MTVQIQSIEWEKDNGETMSKGEFIMHHSCKTRWEDLGIYPTHDDFTKEGLSMEKIEFSPNRPVSLKVSVNDDSTLNFEVFQNLNHEQKVLYGAYLKHVDEINEQLVLMRERFVD